ncbi:MAG TPA: TonB-dependent receptor [Brumimicrobium sp.]|nr:TonB-dependent receptor [Brumimicrobium sp.]
MRIALLILTLISSLYAWNQSISGQIIDSETLEGIPLAKVGLVDYNTQTLTDIDGYFKIIGEFPQEVKCQISAHSFESFEGVLLKNKDNVITLKSIHFDLKEVEVTASKNELKRNSVSHVELKSMEELNEIPKTSLGHMLESLPGVYNSSTGLGISKPVIRGLQGARILTLLNGVRLEGQQWGGDHGMGVSELGIGVIEVLKGPASLQYGSDALGGVIYLSNEKFEQQGKHTIEVQSQFERNTMGTTNALLYNGSLKNLKVLAGARYSNSADYQVGNGQYVINSGYQDINAKLALGWHKNVWISTLRYDFSQSKIGIPGHAHSEDLDDLFFLSDKRERIPTDHVQNLGDHIVSWENKFVLKKHTIQASLGFTINSLAEFSDEHDHDHGEEEEEEEDHEHEEHLEMAIKTYNLPYRINIDTRLKNNLSLSYGIQGMILKQNNDVEAEERLLPDATQYDNGAYFILNWNKDKWRFQAGLRGDLRIVSSATDEKFEETFSQTYGGLNFSIGSNYAITSEHILRINATSGYRIPHLSELLSDGEHHGAFRYEVGNRELKTEKAIQLDVAYEYTAKHLSIVFNPFINGVQDYIYIQAQDSIIDDVQLYQYQQSTKPVLQVGSDIGVHYHPHFAHFLHIESTFSYLRMIAQQTDEFSFVPQPRWSNSIIAQLEMKSKFKVDNIVLQHHYYLPQNQVSTYEKASVDYSVVDLGVGLSYGTKLPLKLQIGVKNIFNQRYINHLSRLKNYGIENPGRSFYAKLIVKINAK